ncbi:MAG TPA: TonB-dependent receptor [Ferruginibacter sp.]|nr:TonB-dependent receptor [Ferruginibacter sp.]
MNALAKSILFYSFFISLLGTNKIASSQNSIKDTGFNKIYTIDEITVSTTRTIKSIGDIPVPIQVISKKFIQQTGSQKLIDILQQQTGLVLADNPLGQSLQGYPNPFGSGIQMQGLDPSYTLILMDGEPLTGRNAGILNLGRIAVGNIKQVEIIKGPATSLYGSDALAGVINIITEKPTANNSLLQVNQASNNTWGFTANQSFKKNKTAVQFFANRYSSSGYDLDKNIYGQTTDPFRNYSFAGKVYYDFNTKTQLQSSARLFTQKQFNNYLVYTALQPQAVDGSSIETDWGFNNQLFHKLSNKIKLITRLYITGYQNNAEVFTQNDKQLFDKSNMQQFLLKPELQAEIGDKRNEKLIAGAGYNYETVEANRYPEKKRFNAFYFFSQKEWLLNNKLNITVGGRLDKHSLYKLQFNPKLALGYKANPNLTINASIGTGFKAPDFRQQFLFFTNTLVGYTLLGANELANGLTQMQQQGQIDQSINLTPYLGNQTLLPEKSVGINLGGRYLLHNKTTFSLNIFRNDINKLIDRYNLPFTKTNGQSIFSYININNVFTQGFDVNINHQLSKIFSINTGYQYLEAKDKDVVKKIKNGEMVKRDPVTFVSSYVTSNEYGGLFNRSKHSANFQLFYNSINKKWDANIRANYRGRFGFSDINGDNILDDDREYVKGYVLLNAIISKSFKQGFEIQAGAENILNHKDKDKLPNLPGITYLINFNINLNQLLTKNL